MIARTVFAAVALTVAAAPAQALIIDLVGDIDGYGVPGAPADVPDGTLWRTDLGGVFFTDYSDPSDPPFTDEWFDETAVSFEHDYILPLAPVSALLDLRIAGIHDINTDDDYEVTFNGDVVGLIPPNFGGGAGEESLTYAFLVPTGLLTGADTVAFTTSGSDGYTVDFSRLTIETQGGGGGGGAEIPLPATLPLLAGAAALLAWRRRR